MSKTVRSWSLCAAFVLSFVAPAAAQPDDRPRIGLALGGGGARGLAHVGVLQWLEEHRIPVDAIAGTSIGGLVAGGYAVGRSADELAQLLRDTDWDALFLADIPFDLREFRRKEDRREYPIVVEFGLKDGLSLPSGLSAGHQIGLFLSRLAFPYAAPLDFDDLPIPLRVVATDLEAAEVVAIGTGALGRALRATMAIPGVFTPVTLDGRLLVDGGLLNNVPVDTVRALGAERVIAVDVGAALAARDEFRSPLDILNQAVGVMMIERSRRQMETADLVITPDVGMFGSTDWRQSDELVRRGYEAMTAVAEEVLPLALERRAWAQHLAERAARRSVAGVPGTVTVIGGEDDTRRDIAALLERHAGAALDLDEFAHDLTRLVGTGRYGSLSYTMHRDGTATGLQVDVEEKAYGPPFLNLALEVADEGDAVVIGLGGRITAYDVGAPRAETRFDFLIGSNPGASVRNYRPLGASPLFVAGRASYARETRRFFQNRVRVARFKTERLRIGGDLGVAWSASNELRLGYDVDAVMTTVQVGEPVFDPLDGREQRVSVRWVYDGQDHWIAPSRGTRATADVTWVTETPYSPRGYTQGRVTTSTFRSLGPLDRFFLTAEAGTSLGSAPGPFGQFTLGGALRLSAFEVDEWRGDHLIFASTGYLREVGRLPDLLGGRVFLLGAFEAGSTFDQASTARVRGALTAGLLLETALGPVAATGSVGDGGTTSFSLGLRPLF